MRGAGLDVNQAAQQDGEGSSGYFTPDFMVRYLAWVRAAELVSVSVPRPADHGRGRHARLIQKKSPAAGKVFAKTGTDGSTNYLNDGEIVEKGLAGYITTKARPARRLRVLYRRDERSAR